MPITTPAAAATSADRSGAIGKGMPQEVENVLRMYAETPAKVSWAREI